jgi:hypothetical protein
MQLTWISKFLCLYKAYLYFDFWFTLLNIHLLNNIISICTIYIFYLEIQVAGETEFHIFLEVNKTNFYFPIILRVLQRMIK